MGRRTVPGGKRLQLVISTTIVTTKKTPLLEQNASTIFLAPRQTPHTTHKFRGMGSTRLQTNKEMIETAPFCLIPDHSSREGTKTSLEHAEDNSCDHSYHVRLCLRKAVHANYKETQRSTRAATQSSNGFSRKPFLVSATWKQDVSEDGHRRRKRRRTREAAKLLKSSEDSVRQQFHSEQVSSHKNLAHRSEGSSRKLLQMSILCLLLDGTDKYQPVAGVQ